MRGAGSSVADLHAWHEGKPWFKMEREREREVCVCVSKASMGLARWASR